MRRGDTSTNLIIFLTVIIASMILVVWYLQALRPMRETIGAVQEDMRELNQHFANACSATRYNATYLFATTRGTYSGNTTHFCIYADVYSDCRRYPHTGCVAPARIDLSEDLIISIRRDGGNVTLS